MRSGYRSVTRRTTAGHVAEILGQGPPHSERNVSVALPTIWHIQDTS